METKQQILTPLLQKSNDYSRQLYGGVKYANYPQFLSYIANIYTWDNRSAMIIQHRLASLNEHDKLRTLQEVGNYFALTRERVRQVEKTFLLIIKNQFDAEPIFKNFLTELKAQKVFDVDELLKSVKPIFPNFEVSDCKMFACLLEKIDAIKQIKIHLYEPIYTSLDATHVIWTIYQKLVRLNTDGPIKPDIFIDIAEKHSVSVEMVNLILKCSGAFVFIQNRIWKKRQNAKSLREMLYRADIIQLVLEKEQRPMHFSEIAKILRDKFEYDVADHSVQGELLRKSNRFYRVGHGLYALNTDELIKGKTEDVIEYFLNDKGQPATFNEISNFVSTQRKLSDGAIVLAINRSPQIIHTYHGYYGLKKWGIAEKTPYSINLSVGIRKILMAASIPLSARQISEKIKEIYGEECSSNQGSIAARLVSAKKLSDVQKTLDNRYFLLRSSVKPH